MDFLYWLLDTWHMGYSVPIGDHVDNHLYVLFNSVSPDPPVPLVKIQLHDAAEKTAIVIFDSLCRLLFGRNRGQPVIFNRRSIFISYIRVILRFYSNSTICSRHRRFSLLVATFFWCETEP